MKIKQNAALALTEVPHFQGITAAPSFLHCITSCMCIPRLSIHHKYCKFSDCYDWNMIHS